MFSILFLNVLRMDILGSVFALLLARFIGSAASVILLFFWKAPVKMTFGQIFTGDKGILRSTLQVSIPLGLEQVCSSWKCGGRMHDLLAPARRPTPLPIP